MARGDAQSSCKVSTWHTHTHTHTHTQIQSRERLDLEVTVSLKAKAEQSLKTQRKCLCVCVTWFVNEAVFGADTIVWQGLLLLVAGYTHMRGSMAVDRNSYTHAHTHIHFTTLCATWSNHLLASPLPQAQLAAHTVHVNGYRLLCYKAKKLTEKKVDATHIDIEAHL